MSRGSIFDLQRYAVHDGPGIRTLVFFKGCPLRCAWCCNPESRLAWPELLRRPALCASCGSCIAACPAGAIRRDDRGGPAIDRRLCRACPGFACAEACPNDALARVGREADARELLAQIEQDRDFYRNSGGGVTFSGGEPFMQPGFLGELLAGCRELDIDTAVETCGHASTEDLLALDSSVDLFLFDLKVLDPERHRALTGQDNRLILENFRRLAGRCPAKLVARLTVVPGVSDVPENLSALASFLRQCGIGAVELLPYHPLGLGKWEGLDLEPACRPDPGLAGVGSAEAARFFARQGFACAVP